MTVSNLIKILSECNPDLEVFCRYYDFGRSTVVDLDTADIEENYISRTTDTVLQTLPEKSHGFQLGVCIDLL